MAWEIWRKESSSRVVFILLELGVTETRTIKQ
jgi:hypothetical protein